MNPKYPKPSACQGCSLQTAGFGFAPPSGPLRGRLNFVGEALGYEEGVWGVPFYGAAGGVLSRLCQRAGINREDVRIGNAISCRPPHDYLVGAPYEEHALSCCRTYLDAFLAGVEPDGVVVTLGNTALDAVLRLRGVPGVQVKDFHGTVNRDPTNRFWVVPTFHPSFLQRGKMNLLQVVVEDLRLADRISQRGFVRTPTTLVTDPGIDWFRWWVSDHLAKVAADVDGTHLSIDTEFPEKAGGKDESEVTAWNALSPITRVNGANSGELGWTVPYRGEYIAEIERLYAGVCALGGWIWYWNKYADTDHLAAAGHTMTGALHMDGMWLWKYLQSDVYRGLGFVAPVASDFGPWKHWAADKAREADYAAADGVQNWRTCMWVLRTAVNSGMFDVYMRDWHERDRYCLRPAYHVGVPVNRPALEQFHADLQVKLATVLEKLKATEAAGTLKPKDGYAKRPKGKVIDGVEQPPTPPAGLFGSKGGKKSEAKLAYLQEGVSLVEREIEVEIRICVTCKAEGVGPKHRCPRPKVAKPRKLKSAPCGKKRQHDAGVVESDRPAGLDGPAVDGGVARRDPAQGQSSLADVAADDGGGGHAGAADPATGGSDSSGPGGARLVTVTRAQRRWFWQLPFNPDARNQILAYLDAKGIAAPVDKKTQKKTTNKKALEDLKAKYRDDPFFQLQLDWKAVQKVDSVYALGTLARLDADDRVHPEYQPIPATLRDSAKNPNLTNVVGDKAGPQSLAAGFRRCIEARDGLPPGVTADDYAAWEARWT